MEITENEKEILADMAQYLKQQNRLYSEKNCLAEQFLLLALPILLELGERACLLLSYVKAMRRQARLVTVYHTYCAGKECGRRLRPCNTGYFSFLCATFSAPEAEDLDELLWAFYRDLTCQLSRPDYLDELTDLYREMQSCSAELSLEVFEAGYIAGLKQREQEFKKRADERPYS